MAILNAVSFSWYEMGRITHSPDQRTQDLTPERHRPSRRRPVGPDSRLIPCPGVRHESEPGDPGMHLLVDTNTGARHQVSPQAGARFDELDGRALVEVWPELGDDPAAALAVIELLRRLRALDLIEDLDLTTPSG